MLGENIRTLRKSKGYSQETLAQQLNVVRQTISKWEKGLSVPDAEQLERMAELFEVPVAELLQTDAPSAETEAVGMNEVVLQLAVLNEQLAHHARSRRRLLKIVLICIIVLIVLPLFLCILGAASFTSLQITSEGARRDAVYVLNGEEHHFYIEYDENGRILEMGSDPFIRDLLDSRQFEDAEAAMEFVDNWFAENGGAAE